MTEPIIFLFQRCDNQAADSRHDCADAYHRLNKIIVKLPREFFLVRVNLFVHSPHVFAVLF